MDGDWFKSVMSERGVTRADLALTLGRSRDKIDRIINGRQPLSVEEAHQISSAIGLTLGQFLLGTKLATEADLKYEKAHESSLPLLFRVGSFDSVSGSHEIKNSKKMITIPHDLYQRAGESGFAAEMADDSADRIYLRGSWLICALVGEGQQLLPNGARVIFKNHTGSHITSEPFEIRLGIVTPSPDGRGLMLVSPTTKPQHQFSIWLDRKSVSQQQKEKSDSRPTMLEYSPESHDQASIIGLVVGNISGPEKEFI